MGMTVDTSDHSTPSQTCGRAGRQHLPAPPTPPGSSGQLCLSSREMGILFPGSVGGKALKHNGCHQRCRVSSRCLELHPGFPSAFTVRPASSRSPQFAF